ncbi:D-2-hydroxyacid dehydrogenase [Phototrophicus methaneseepsis]|uniref:D-2-hydroxyacid dehydrogenase n=1 Tax=Phototrophicus methaneseepsis TaxID=2710758 RepID=A0A7S8E858_9CHLR|nr:D-2-hydroxyacid dehydrogenase [Phototrophicus methaneseepsis]QPC82173.1 D-2-hydroxyacid dehydrogenase [Phototrophicus methaneseepsis]
MSNPETDKIKVIVANDFSDDIMAQLKAVSPRLDITRYKEDVPSSAWAEAEVLYTGRTFPLPEQAPRLRWIQLPSAGMDSALHHPIVQAEDVVITSTSGMHAKQLANYTWLMILAFNFDLPKWMINKGQSLWPENPLEGGSPVDVDKQTVGIVGYGSIGREIARLAQAFGMRVLASKRDIKNPAQSESEYMPAGIGDPEGDIPERIYPGEAVATMAAESDYLAVTLPLTEGTRHMINERVFDSMKPNAVIINVGRGGVIDEKAMITALSSGKIRGAGLDVFEEEPLPSTSPLWNLDNVIISPHVGGATSTYQEQAAAIFAENLRRYVDNRPLLNALQRDTGY